MKIFRNLLDSVKPTFSKGGKLEKLFPAYDAFETFLFVPNQNPIFITFIMCPKVDDFLW